MEGVMKATLALAIVFSFAASSSGGSLSEVGTSLLPAPHRFASIRDDPHFSSPDGVPFDFHGDLDKAYCLTTDEKLHINAVLKGYKDKRPFGASAPDKDGFKRRTWMKELGIMWVDPKGIPHRLHLVARADRHSKRRNGYLKKITIDGHPIAMPYDGRRIERSNMLFQYTGILKLPREEQETFALTIGDLLGASIVMRPANKHLQTKDDAQVHFNLNFYFINTTESIHGVLGQTYRTTKEQAQKSAKFQELVGKERQPIQADQESGKGFLDGQVKDYEASTATKADCRMSQFLVKSKKVQTK